LRRDDRAATAIEYGMIAALIAAVIVGVLSTLGDQLITALMAISDSIIDAIGGNGGTDGG